MSEQGQDEVPFGTRMTLEEWAELPEGVHGELVDGVLVEEEMTNLTHALVTVGLVRSLDPWARGRGGFVLGPGPGLAIGPKHGRIPDLMVVLPGDVKPRLHDRLFRHPPSLVVEIVSPSPRDARRDRIEKAAEYAGWGAPHYWIVDPSVRTLDVLDLGENGRYATALHAAGGKLDRLPGCPGLVLDLDALWAEIDRAGEE